MRLAVRRALLRLLYPLARAMAWLGSISGAITGGRWRKYMPDIELMDGDVILTRSRFVPTNLVIPGEYKHAAMYVGDGEIVEATWPEVRIDDAARLFGRAHRFAVMRARALSGHGGVAAGWMRDHVGTPYDLMFEPGEKAMYCSEAVYHAIRKEAGDWDFTPRERFGVKTVTPNDIRLAEKHFDVVYEHAGGGSRG